MASKKNKMQWYQVDLHLHTMASMDYHDKDASYLDILKEAEKHGLDIIAFTDHNTVGGYAAMQREIEQLEYLKKLDRATKAELDQLKEYDRLLDKILVLPGVEFTATFGFHILGIFSPKTTVREIEHLLMNLSVPVQAIEEGNSEVGASSDVLHAYQLINEAGGIVIAAHANANHGVAMRGMDFGGQTRIAYTQDSNLYCLEVTDLGSRRRYSTQRFFNGTKPEYPRKMRCIQGSDAHALKTVTDRRGKVVTLGVGERTTEMLLSDKSFEALEEMLSGNDFSRSRAYEGGGSEDYVQTAREEGESIVQSFHESMQRKGGHLYSVVSDVCAFANTNGGTVYIGAVANPKKSIKGVSDAAQSKKDLDEAIGRMISPELDYEVDTLESNRNTVIRIQVPKGKNRPYAIDEYKIYVRDDNETNLAVRDEIVSLVRQGMEIGDVPAPVSASPKATATQSTTQPASQSAREKPSTSTQPTEAAAAVASKPAEKEKDGSDNGKLHPATKNHANPPKPYKPPEVGSVGATMEDSDGIPRAGVEIVGTEHRNGTNYHIMRDLRNGNIVHNVTRESARRLWHYAIRQLETNPVTADSVQWDDEGEIGLWRSYKRGNDVRYDLVKREKNGKLRVFYGVSEAGMSGRWQQFLEPDDD